ncbi:hypothetical protein LOTGIDRAFT_56205, partial [Lottia gigantea]
ITLHPESQMLYCPVLKVGSTFWRRVLYALDTNTPIHTPYDIPIQKALSAKHANLFSELKTNKVRTEHFLENESLKMMFVREPFTRLISGYIDKIFAPNPYFWSVIGKYIIRNFRVNATEKSKKCGHDVTFPEFIKYVIHSEATNNTARDAHFTPIYDQCKPCEIKYNVVGKMESFLNDTTFIMNNIGFNITLLHARNHSKHNKKQQKLEALTDAFNQISSEDKLKLRKLFLPDFKLFDYESTPAYI